VLELRSVHAGYGSFQALFDVSLEVRQGEAVGVIGPNGAGKTTLMSIVAGLDRNAEFIFDSTFVVTPRNC